MAKVIGVTANRLLLIASLGLLLFGIWQTARVVRSEPGGDLRNRVAVARRMLAGIDPYLGPEAQLPDYYRSYTPSTASPVQFLLYVPLAALPYHTQRWAYFAIDWLITAIVFLLLRRLVPQVISTQYLLLLFSTLLFLDTSFVMHFARGQIYLGLLLVSTVVAMGLLNPEHQSFAIAALALLILLRPTYILLLVGLTLLGQARVAFRTLILTAVLATVSISFLGLGVWREYAAMLERSQAEHLEIVTGQYRIRATNPVIEHDDYRKATSFHGWESDRTFLGTFGHGRLNVIARVKPQTLLRLNNVLLAATTILLLFLLFRIRAETMGFAQAGMLLLIPITVETFGPQRYPYSDVLLVLPILCATALLAEKRAAWIPRLLVVFAIYSGISRIHTGFLMSGVSETRFAATVSVLIALFVSARQGSSLKEHTSPIADCRALVT